MTHTIISIDAEKAFNEIQRAFIINVLGKTGWEGTCVPQPNEGDL